MKKSVAIKEYGRSWWISRVHLRLLGLGYNFLVSPELALSDFLSYEIACLYSLPVEVFLSEFSRFDVFISERMF
jgi:hypothetical protein